MNCTIRILIALTALTTTVPSLTLAAEPGFYFGATIGRAEEDPKSKGLDVAGGLFPTEIFHLEPSQVAIDTGSVAWGALVGYRINRYFAAELEYMDFGTTDVTESYDLPTIIPPLPGVLTRSYSSRVNGPALSVLGTLPVSEAWDVFLSAGVLFADRKIEGLIAGPNDNTFGSTVWLAGAGVEWSVSSRWALRAEYQRSGELDDSFLAGRTELERMTVSVLARF